MKAAAELLGEPRQWHSVFNHVQARYNIAREEIFVKGLGFAYSYIWRSHESA